MGLGIGKGALSICFPLDCYNSIVKTTQQSLNYTCIMFSI